MDEQNNVPLRRTRVEERGKNEAMIALILGILCLVFCFIFPLGGNGYLLSVILGIVGCVFARKSKKAGNTGSARILGLIFSWIGIVCGIIGSIGCVINYIEMEGLLDTALDELY